MQYMRFIKTFLYSIMILSMMIIISSSYAENGTKKETAKEGISESSKPVKSDETKKEAVKEEAAETDKNIKSDDESNEEAKEPQKPNAREIRKAQRDKTAKPVDNKSYYTAYNLWFESPEKISSVNYQKGSVIPAGTKITRVRTYMDNIVFETESPDRVFKIFFIKKYHPGISIKQFRDRLFVDESFDELTRNFKPEEIAQIKKCEIAEGMSKEAVTVLYGYPPEHKTFSPTSNRWIYWRSTFKKRLVSFDENNRSFEFKDEDDPEGAAESSENGDTTDNSGAKNTKDNAKNSNAAEKNKAK